ncbi:MAG: hypothetical protein JXX29_00285 [Deltaproteobacteria bacterium]|nr:hypothetical protein [Deltaproteobacteria bacterium]MBN2670073.1 hypothetical protein [Deltaproteobacteria bacterium]
MNKWILGRCVILLLLVQFVSTTARGEPEGGAEEIGPGWVVKADLYGIYNPMGVVITTELTYNVPYRYKYDIVWSHMELGYRVAGTVTHSVYGVHLEWMPAAFFKLRANYDLQWFHGTMASLLELPSKDSPHDDDDVFDYGTEKMRIGHRVWLAPTLQLLFKGVAFVNQTDLKWYLIDSEQPYFYNWEYATVTERKDFLISSMSLLMYNFLKNRSPRSLFVGGSYEMVSQPSTSFRRQTLGGVLLTEPFVRSSRIGTLHFLVLAGVYLEETYRNDELFVVFNFGTTFDSRTMTKNERFTVNR